MIPIAREEMVLTTRKSNQACTMAQNDGPIIRTLTANPLDFVDDESGQDLIEYALVAALIGLAAVSTLKGLSGKIGNSFNSIGNDLTANV